MNEVSLEQWSAGRFAELVATVFAVHAGDNHIVALELTAVTPSRTAEAGESASRYESFSLIFDGPADWPMAQRIYTFEHERIGRFDLFIVPVGNEGGRRQYQAVFNRLRQDKSC